MLRTSGQHDLAVEAQLDQWVVAKREKDFATADAIRADLRAQGIDPDTVRPSDKVLQQLGPGHAEVDHAIEAQLDQWVQAKREKDFEAADAIRADLRARGVDPDIARPSDKQLAQWHVSSGAKFDPVIEAQLDQWVQAKRDKDFLTADAIRAELRTLGVDPDIARPSDKAMQHWSGDRGMQQWGGGQGSTWVASPVAVTTPTFGPAIEAKLDAWVQAKRDKDFVAADALRADLRAVGVDPDTVRPSDRAVQQQWVGGNNWVAATSSTTPRYNSAVEAKLEQWVAAKRAKDFELADSIRSELRGVGVNPDTVRPSDKDWAGMTASQSHLLMPQQTTFAHPWGAVGSTSRQRTGVARPKYGPIIEGKLDRWVAAKREKDFATADALRQELRQLGIDPDIARPSDKDLAAALHHPASPSSQVLGSSFASLPQRQNQEYPNIVGARFDPITEAKLDRWVVAKREKDFQTADDIRADLRASGIDPDIVRPSDKMIMAKTPIGPDVEAKLDQWVAAKRDKDFAAADAIRSELRALGIEPDILRPADTSATLVAGQRFDPATDAKLDRWVQAKRDKDWAAADSIRTELRSAGIEPDIVRPPDKNLGPFDLETEAKLDRWVQAKREKDFIVADALRLELRNKGIEPDLVRPSDRDLQSMNHQVGNQAAYHQHGVLSTAPQMTPPSTPPPLLSSSIISSSSMQAGTSNMPYDVSTEARLDQWVAAKRDKDFTTADAIREELRAKGIEPDLVRPSDKDLQRTSAVDAAVEVRLDQWVQAKRDKDFATADAIRAELRANGIEPDLVRPSDKDLQQQTMTRQGLLPAQAFFNTQYGAASAHQQQPAFSMAPQMSPPSTPHPFNAPGLLMYQQMQPMAVQTGNPMMLGTSAMQAPAAMGATTMVYDAETESQLDQWVAAKREKDFATADSIREQLRAKGIEPDRARPSDKDLVAAQPQWSGFLATAPSGGFQPQQVEWQLDRWVEAKRAKDFETADQIRRQLRAQGIDPDIARPAGVGAEPDAKRMRLG
mmetsp:Transcript_129296/g.322292  ORF Transcript_129296/g.322292 Transcript_129296/m.322292 type:complete len:1016 (+) Transcript_129296:43-3090(+)